jgi:hypothetical protein
MKKDYSKLLLTLVLAFGFAGTSGVSGQVDPEKPLPHFLFPSFREGRIVMKDGTSFNTMLNYNLLEQRMVTELNGTYRYSRDPALIDTIFIEDLVFVPVDKIFYEILSAGKNTFYVQHRAMFIAAGQEVGYGVKSQTTGPTQIRRFELDNFYGEVAYMDIPTNGEVRPSPVFWVSKGNNLEKFVNARQLMKIFPEYKPEIQNYTDKEKIDFKTAREVGMLGDYLNSMEARQ